MKFVKKWATIEQWFYFHENIPLHFEKTIYPDKVFKQVFEGKQYYIDWLLTEQEKEIVKKNREQVESADIWNECAQRTVDRCYKAYDQGKTDKEKNLNYFTSNSKNYTEYIQSFYNAGFDKIDQNIVFNNVGWFTTPTIIDIDVNKIWKERDSEENRNNFIKWFNELDSIQPGHNGCVELCNKYKDLCEHP